MSVSDTSLFLRWSDRRDPEAFRILTKRYSGMVYATSLRILHDATEAEDVTQECFEKLALMSDGPKGYLGAWLHRVATNRAIDRLRQTKRRIERDKRFAAKQKTTTEIVWDDVYQYVDEAIAALPVKLREPLIKHYLEGCTHTEIAQEIGLSRVGVTKRIAAGVDALRSTLKRKGVPIASGALAGLLSRHAVMAEPISPQLEATLGKIAVAGVKVIPDSNSAGKRWLTLGTAMALILIAALGVVQVSKLKHTPGSSLASNPPGDIEADAQVIAPSTTQNDEPIPEQATLEREIETQLQQSVDTKNQDARIQGRVYNQNTLSGFAGITMTAYRQEGEGGDYFTYAVTDEDGYYAITGLGTGRYKVYPEQKQYDVVFVSATLGKTEESVDFALAGGSVSGMVVDTEGNPVSGAKVRVEAETTKPSESMVTRPDGTFDFFGYDPTAIAKIQASTEEYMSPLVGPVKLGSNGKLEALITLSEPRTCSVQGVVVSPTGVVLSDVRVVVEPIERDLMGYDSTHTDESGYFLLSGLTPGERRVILSPPHFDGWSVKGEVMRINLVPGKSITGLRLVFDEGLGISGRVTDDSGKPLEYIDLTAKSASGFFHARTDQDGRFRISQLKEGVYDVVVHTSGFATASKEKVPAGSDGIDLVLVRHGTIEGRVINAENGKPVKVFGIQTTPGNQRSLPTDYRGVEYETIQNEEGRFSITAPVGEALLIVRAPGFKSAFLLIEDVQSGQTSRNVEVKLSQGETITGCVVDEEGNPVAHAAVFVGPIPPVDHQRETKVAAYSSEDGTFQIDELNGDEPLLTAYHPDYAQGLLILSENSTVEIVLPRGGRIEGVITQDGIPVQKASIMIQNLIYDNAVYFSVQSDENGYYHHDAVLDGSTRVRVRLNGLPWDHEIKRNVDVRSGETSWMNVDFLPFASVLEGTLSVNGEVPSVNSIFLYFEAGDNEECIYLRCDENGYFRCDNVPAGTGRLVYLTDGGRIEIPFNVDEGVVVRQDIIVE